MGFDTQHIYVAVVTPHTGDMTARHWGERDMPLWDEESCEIFLGPVGSAAAELIQLIGNPYGDQTDFRYGSLAWRGEWRWAARRDEQTWAGELKAAFTGIEAPLPTAAESWYLNLYNTRANAAWSPAQGSYRSLENMGAMRFDRLAPAIRPGHVSLAEGMLAVPWRFAASERSGPMTWRWSCTDRQAGFRSDGCRRRSASRREPWKRWTWRWTSRTVPRAGSPCPCGTASACCFSTVLCIRPCMVGKGESHGLLSFSPLRAAD